jgi:hypothetical protein
MTLEIALTNISPQAINVAQGEILQDELDYDFDVRDAQTKPAPETKHLKAIKGEDQGPGPQTVIVSSFGYAQLKPHETLKSFVDLTQLFELSPGKYSVQVTRLDLNGKTVVKSNRISFAVD